jgi:hypothetical protein
MKQKVEVKQEAMNRKQRRTAEYKQKLETQRAEAAAQEQEQEKEVVEEETTAVESTPVKPTTEGEIIVGMTGEFAL